MIQNEINNLVSIAIFLLYDWKLPSQKKSENGNRDEF